MTEIYRLYINSLSTCSLHRQSWSRIYRRPLSWVGRWLSFVLFIQAFTATHCILHFIVFSHIQYPQQYIHKHFYQHRDWACATSFQFDASAYEQLCGYVSSSIFQTVHAHATHPFHDHPWIPDLECIFNPMILARVGTCTQYMHITGHTVSVYCCLKFITERHDNSRIHWMHHMKHIVLRYFSISHFCAHSGARMSH